MRYDGVEMARQVVFATLALLIAADCHGSDPNAGLGCAGADVLITVTPSRAADAAADAAPPGDGGGADAKPSCTGKCDDYLEALRVAIEGATPANCVRYPLSTVLACAPSPASPESCPRDTIDAATALNAQIRAYLHADWPEIDSAAVVLDTCVCHID